MTMDTKAPDIAVVFEGEIKNWNDSQIDNVGVYCNVSVLDTIMLSKKLEKDGTKAIVTSAAAALAIKNEINIPIVTATHSLFDIVETLIDYEKVTGKISGRIIIIIHKTKQLDITKLRHFTNNHLEIAYYDDISDIENVVNSVLKSANDVVMGGAICRFYADKHGSKSCPMAFGKETVMLAIDTAKLVLAAKLAEEDSITKLNAIMDLFDGGVLMSDRNGYITNINNNAIKSFHLSSKDILGKKIEDITDDIGWLTSYINGISFKEKLKKYKDNNYLVSDYPILSDNGKLLGSIASFKSAGELATEHPNTTSNRHKQIKAAGLIAKSKFDDILGNSKAIKSVIEEAKSYSKVDSTILIHGETGSGKELFAQSIHNYSERRHGPFVAINCATLPENLLESELMGHEEGAFTGSRKGGKLGLFELANKGTLFLDEINHVPLSLQARLLRVLQEKQLMRLGGEKIIPVDIRIIAATNENLKTLVAKKNFREDLYYRLNILEVIVPSLRNRQEDVPDLIHFFSETFRKKYGGSDSFSKNSIEKLSAYKWPGNVRQLAAFVERYIVLAKNNLIDQAAFVKTYTDDLSKHLDDNIDDNEIRLKIDTLDKMEKDIIDAVMLIYDGNKNKTSALLGISRTSLWKKLNNK